MTSPLPLPRPFRRRGGPADKGKDLQHHGLEAQDGAGVAGVVEARGKGAQGGGGGAGVLERLRVPGRRAGTEGAGGHGLSGGGDGKTGGRIARIAGGVSRNSAGDVREPSGGPALGRSRRFVNRQPPGTLEYAMGEALAELGAATVMEETGLTRSILYAGCSANEPDRGFPGLTYSSALMLAGAAAARGRHRVAEALALPFLRLAPRTPAPAHSDCLLHQAAHLGALYGRTAEALCRLFDRAEGRRGPVPLDPRERDAVVAAIDAQIDGLGAMRERLLTSTALPGLAGLSVPLADIEEVPCP